MAAQKPQQPKYDTSSFPLYLKDMVAWLNNPNMQMYGRWNADQIVGCGAPGCAMEGGVDITSPAGTPIYALATGPLEGAGNFWHSKSVYTPGSGAPGYGVVTERVNVPGYGLEDLYYQHIKIAPGIQTCYAGNCNNQVIQKGQLIGWVEPGVNEIEMGMNANWGGVWGTNHPNSWMTDPRGAIAGLMLGAGPNIGSQTPQTPQGGSSCDPNTPVIGYFCNAQNQLQVDIGGIQSWLTQAGIVLFGAILVFGALMLVFKG